MEEAGKAGYDAITCPAVFWMQGEFNYDVKNGHCGLNAGEDNCTDKKTYKALMLKLKENMQQDIKAAYGQEQAPVWITYQVGAQYVRDKVAIGMAQLEAANENDDVVMAGSPYPYTDRGGHLDANGYRWFGEMLAKAYYKSRVLGERVIPLQPKKITRENGGKTIRVKYYVPVGPMVFDTDRSIKASAPRSERKQPEFLSLIFNFLIPRSEELLSGGIAGSRRKLKM